MKVRLIAESLPLTQVLSVICVIAPASWFLEKPVDGRTSHIWLISWHLRSSFGKGHRDHHTCYIPSLCAHYPLESTRVWCCEFCNQTSSSRLVFHLLPSFVMRPALPCWTLLILPVNIDWLVGFLWLGNFCTNESTSFAGHINERF